MVKKKFVIALIAFWGTVLIGFIVFKQYTLQTGTEVMLKTAPIDPRDLFRGDYVILRYEINTIDLNSILSQGESFNKNDHIYLKLDTGLDYAKPIEISKESFDEGIYISGTITNVNGRTLGIKYGIETYFVRQGQGREIERKRGDLDVRIAIDKHGNSLIKALVYDGEILE